MRALSGTPYNVSAGFDIDGDGQTQNDRPVGLPATVGREEVDESLRIINELRASRNLAPITEDHLELEPVHHRRPAAQQAGARSAGRSIEFFAESYNLFNRVNYAGGGNSSIISPAFLVRNAARDPRQVQFGARFSF